MEATSTWIKKAMALAMAFNIVAVGSSAGFPFSTAPPSGSTTSFQQCYVGCFILCAIQPSSTLSSCGFECLRDCLMPQTGSSTGNTAATTASASASRNAVATSFDFCNLGCASTRCISISTLDNPRGKEVAGCVGSCSGMCRKNYKPAP